MLPTQVGDIMSTALHTCAPETPASDAAAIMWNFDCGVVPVVDAQFCPVGVITDRDLCMAAYTRGQALHTLRVADVMTQQPVALRACEPITEALALMEHHQIRRLLVVEASGRLCGVLSLNDVARKTQVVDATTQPEVLPEHLAVTLAAICQPRSELHSRAVHAA